MEVREAEKDILAFPLYFKILAGRCVRLYESNAEGKEVFTLLPIWVLGERQFHRVPGTT